MGIAGSTTNRWARSFKAVLEVKPTLAIVQRTNRYL
jgi:hypothetical protein